ncbi:MAG: AMP-binding protein [Candidatus Nanopelagicales bacterium]
MNLAENLARTAASTPDQVAIRLDDLELTYAGLDAASALAAGWLREHGVGPGDRVGIMLPNIPQFPILYYGALRAGAVSCPDEPAVQRARGRVLPQRLRRQGAVRLGGHRRPRRSRGRRRRARPSRWSMPASRRNSATYSPAPDVVERAPDDTAVLLYTSGTTGKPKGAELTHSNLGSNVATCVALFDGGPGDVIFGGLPLFHSFGQTCGLNSRSGVRRDADA